MLFFIYFVGDVAVMFSFLGRWNFVIVRSRILAHWFGLFFLLLSTFDMVINMVSFPPFFLFCRAGYLSYPFAYSNPGLITF